MKSPNLKCCANILTIQIDLKHLELYFIFLQNIIMGAMRAIEKKNI